MLIDVIYILWNVAGIVFFGGIGAFLMYLVGLTLYDFINRH
jgi:hypothetical protein